MSCLKGRIKSLNLGLSFLLFQNISFYFSLRRSRAVMLSNLPQRVTCRSRSDLWLSKGKVFLHPIKTHLSCPPCEAQYVFSFQAIIPLICNWIIPTISNCFKTQTSLCMIISMNILACVFVLVICALEEGDKERCPLALTYLSCITIVLEKAGIILLIHVQSFFKRQNINM